MNIPKTAKLGLACVAALSYSVIPTYLLKYRWIFRSRQRGIPGREGFVPDI